MQRGSQLAWCPFADQNLRAAGQMDSSWWWQLSVRWTGQTGSALEERQNLMARPKMLDQKGWGCEQAGQTGWHWQLAWAAVQKDLPWSTEAWLLKRQSLGQTRMGWKASTKPRRMTPPEGYRRARRCLPGSHHRGRQAFRWTRERGWRASAGCCPLWKMSKLRE